MPEDRSPPDPNRPPDPTDGIRPVLIVGGGAAGAWQAAWLAARGIPEIDIVEPSATLGRGLAYSAPSPDHLLNVTPGKMDAYPIPGFEGFVPWLARKRLTAPDDYHPRAVFGDYMEDVVATVRRAAKLRHHRVRAVSIARDRHGFAVALDDGRTIAARHVVLALGNLAPHPIAPNVDDPRVIEDPWRLSPRNAAGIGRAVVAGTGLTAVDVVVSLIEASPGVHVTLTAQRPFVPPVDVVADGWPGAAQAPVLPPSRMWRWVVDEIRKDPAHAHWVSVFEGMKTQTGRIWQAWTPAERATFARHGLRHWLHHRHRTPPPSHRLLQRLIRAGQVEVRRGRVAAVRPGPDGIRLTLCGRAAVADVVVNATGPSVRPEDSPLLGAAVDAGLLCVDPLGLGLVADETGQAIGADGRPVPGLWILGAWTRGSHFEVVPVPLLRKHAAAIAGAIRPVP